MTACVGPVADDQRVAPVICTAFAIPKKYGVGERAYESISLASARLPNPWTFQSQVTGQTAWGFCDCRSILRKARLDRQLTQTCTARKTTESQQPAGTTMERYAI